ncbi:hypothetical protein [Chryseobacterium sp. M5A1_1a]
MKKTFPIILFLLFSCNAITNKDKKQTESVKIIRFMGIGSYSTGIYKKIFWTYDEEHMFMYMRKGEFLSDIEKYKETNPNNFKEYAFAFIKAKDTIYADESLKYWLLIRNKKERYYYDEEGETSEFLKKVYPFFRDCPYVSNVN